MNKHIDITGQRFGRLVALSRNGNGPGRSALWLCICDCGAEVTTRGKFLREGSAQSCGCLRKERAAEANSARLFKHGETAGGNSRTYRIWANMVSRCTNPNFDSYPYYGGRGIEVCERWRTFAHFLADMGRAPEGMSIERNDSDGNYEPTNCRWATKREQASNTRRNVHLTMGAETKTMSEWSRHVGLSIGTIHSRLKRGWPVEKALTTPRRKMLHAKESCA